MARPMSTTMTEDVGSADELFLWSSILALSKNGIGREQHRPSRSLLGQVVSPTSAGSGNGERLDDLLHFVRVRRRIHLGALRNELSFPIDDQRPAREGALSLDDDR